MSDSPAMTADRGPDFIPENEAADQRRLFDGAREPMRALRDLIGLCEQTLWPDAEEDAIVSRAQAGFDSLRKLFGDTRLAEDSAFGPMIEPPLPLPDQPPGCNKVRDVVIALL